MNKNDLIEKVSEVTCAKTEAQDAVNALIEAIKSGLISGERVTISGFGSFSVKFQKARTGRNPRTGDTIDILPRKVVRFSPSPSFNEEL